MEIATTSALPSKLLSLSDKVQLFSTSFLALIALLTPILAETYQKWYRSPKLKIKFKLSPPDCHITEWNENGNKTPVYYFRFSIQNDGLFQAEECEVFLEKIFKENSAGKMVEYKGFTPVNLKWSGVRDPLTKIVQPGRAVFCDLGRIHHPSHGYNSIFHPFSKYKSDNKFVFEFTDKFYSQWDCLLPGKYSLVIAVYSKNAPRVTSTFRLAWSGKWQDKEQSMFDELVIQ